MPLKTSLKQQIPGQRALLTLCASLLVLTLSGCAMLGDGGAGDRGNAQTVSSGPSISYRIVASPGPGATKLPYAAHLFPPIRMSKNGSPIEKMVPVQGEGGEIKSWRVSSGRSGVSSHWVEQSFRSGGYRLFTFPQLLAFSQPYSVVVVSSFYTSATPIKDPVEGGPDHTVTVKVKGALFGLDMDPAKSQPVGTVLCTGFYSAKRDNVKEVTGKLLGVAASNLGDQFEGFGTL